MLLEAQLVTEVPLISCRTWPDPPDHLLGSAELHEGRDPGWIRAAARITFLMQFRSRTFLLWLAKRLLGKRLLCQKVLLAKSIVSLLFAYSVAKVLETKLVFKKIYLKRAV